MDELDAFKREVDKAKGIGLKAGSDFVYGV
jgi:hypothetical protein